MNERGTQLLDMANGQISELIVLITRGEAALSLLCPGREKLGDGTVAAVALHTAGNYHRIAGFLDGDGRHHPIAQSRHGHGQCQPHGDHRAETIDLQALLDRLSTGRAALSALADLTDEQLDSVPPASDMKFCDGQRTLEQIMTNLLNHQSHQLDALKAAIA
jgi:hypothetical protein